MTRASAGRAELLAREFSRRYLARRAMVGQIVAQGHAWRAVHLEILGYAARERRGAAEWSAEGRRDYRAGCVEAARLYLAQARAWRVKGGAR